MLNLPRHPTTRELENKAFLLGQNAATIGQPVSYNPYVSVQSNLARKWEEGHQSMNVVKLFAET